MNLTSHKLCDLEFDDESDNIQTLLYHICDSISEIDGILFEVSGFEKDPWPVNKYMDLDIFLKQIPDILENINSEIQTFYLNFPEQAIQKLLTFTKKNGLIEITCQCTLTNWEPIFDKEIIETNNLEQMFSNVLKEFIKITKAICVTTYNHPCFQEWINQPSVKKYL